MIEESKFYTAKCDIPDCDSQLTSVDYGFFHVKGWGAVTYHDDVYQLCPFHVKELEGFLLP